MKTFLCILINGSNSDAFAAEIRWQNEDRALAKAWIEVLDLAGPDRGDRIHARVVRAVDAGAARLLTQDKASYSLITSSFEEEQTNMMRDRLPGFDPDTAHRDEAIEHVTQRYLDWTLERMGEDRSDFRDLGKGSLRNALAAAYLAGRSAAQADARSALSAAGFDDAAEVI